MVGEGQAALDLVAACGPRRAQRRVGAWRAGLDEAGAVSGAEAGDERVRDTRRCRASAAPGRGRGCACGEEGRERRVVGGRLGQRPDGRGRPRSGRCSTGARPAARAHGRPTNVISACGKAARRARNAGTAHSMSPSISARKTPMRCDLVGGGERAGRHHCRARGTGRGSAWRREAPVERQERDDERRGQHLEHMRGIVRGARSRRHAKRATSPEATTADMAAPAGRAGGGRSQRRERRGHDAVVVQRRETQPPDLRAIQARMLLVEQRVEQHILLLAQAHAPRGLAHGMQDDRASGPRHLADARTAARTAGRSLRARRAVKRSSKPPTATSALAPDEGVGRDELGLSRPRVMRSWSVDDGRAGHHQPRPRTAARPRHASAKQCPGAASRRRARCRRR